MRLIAKLMILSVLALGFIYSQGRVSAQATGDKWTSIGPYTGNIGAIAIDPSSANIIYVATYGAGVFKSTNGGANWALSNTGLGVHNVIEANALAIDMKDSRVIFAGTGDGVFRSMNGGAGWAKAKGSHGSVIALAIDPSNTNIVYAGTERGLHKTTNGGVDWSLIPIDSRDNYVGSIAIDPITTNVIYIGTFYSVYMSADGGESWNKIGEGLPVTHVMELAIDPSDTSTVYAGTRGYGLFKLQFKQLMITSAVFDRLNRLKIMGRNFVKGSRVLINDTDRTASVVSVSNTSILLRGSAKRLNIKAGENSVQIVKPDGTSSNMFVIKPQGVLLPKGM